jgi:regulator of sirC expression with transglutaminase-like and TPR domain
MSRRLAVHVLGLGVSLATILLPPSSDSAAPLSFEGSLLPALAMVEAEHGGLCATEATAASLDNLITEIVDDARPSLASEPPGPAVVEALNRIVFTRLGIRGSPDLRDPCNLLTSRVLERKQGYCVGIAAVYLALAERLDLPIHAVATPSHVFLRLDDGATRINIETLQQGADIPDEQYIREQKIPEKSIRRGVFMRNLTTDEFLAQVHSNLGVIYSERKDFDKAAPEYERALDLDHRLAAAWYNYANDLLRQGEMQRAIRYFTKSLRLYPTDVWALNNRGLAYVKADKKDKARKDFLEALRLDPGFQQAKQNLAALPSSP